MLVHEESWFFGCKERLSLRDPTNLETSVRTGEGG